MYFLAYEANEFKGFYMEGVHKSIPPKTLVITQALYEYLLSLQDFKLVDHETLENRIYDLSDKNLFEEVLPEMKQEVSELEVLTEQNAQLIMNSAMKDAQIEQLNQTVSDLVMTVAMGGLKNGLL